MLYELVGSKVVRMFDTLVETLLFQEYSYMYSKERSGRFGTLLPLVVRTRTRGGLRPKLEGGWPSSKVLWRHF